MSGKRISYGYQLKDGIIQADEKTSQMLQEIFETYSKGIPISKMKDHIKGLELNRTKISDILRDARYLGDENIPQIIDAVLFEMVQQRRKEHLKEIGKDQSYLYHKNQFLLGDKMKCGECGSDYHCYKHGNTQIWDCSKRLVKGRVTCRNQRIQEEQIMNLFIQVIKKMKKHPALIRNVTIKMRKNNTRIKAVEREIEMMKNSQNYEVDELLKLIYKRASLQYEQSDDGSREYYTKKIEKLIQQQKNQETTEPDTALFDTIIKNIVIYQDGRVQFILKNGAIVEEDSSEEKKGEQYE